MSKFCNIACGTRVLFSFLATVSLFSPQLLDLLGNLSTRWMSASGAIKWAIEPFYLKANYEISNKRHNKIFIIEQRGGQQKVAHILHHILSFRFADFFFHLTLLCLFSSLKINGKASDVTNWRKLWRKKSFDGLWCFLKVCLFPSCLSGLMLSSPRDGMWDRDGTKSGLFHKAQANCVQMKICLLQFI
jgi:hypothetical protein